MKYLLTALVIILASTACMNKATEETILDAAQKFTEDMSMPDCTDDMSLSSDIFLSELCKPDNTTEPSILMPY